MLDGCGLSLGMVGAGVGAGGVWVWAGGRSGGGDSGGVEVAVGWPLAGLGAWAASGVGGVALAGGP